MIDALTKEFVPVAGDDYYRRRQDDHIGEFFRRVADQSPRKGENGATRQGIYAFTADGQLLAFGRSYRPRDVLRMLDRALDEWAWVDKDQKRPRTFDEQPGTLDQRYARRSPAGGLILRVYARELELRDGKHSRAPARNFGRRNLASLDHMWITKAERDALIPPRDTTVGTLYRLPPAVAMRLARFHLVDNTRGEPPMWSEEDVKQIDLTIRVAALEPDAISLELTGTAQCENSEGSRGYKAQIDGRIEYDRKDESFRRFDLVAVGDHWGEGRFNKGARAGAKPLGIAFELSDGSLAADSVPPQGARNLASYIGH